LKAAEGDRPDLADDDPGAVRLMIDYLYLDDYDPGALPAANATPSVTVDHAIESTQTKPTGEDPWNFGIVSTTPSFGTDAPPPEPDVANDPWGAIPRKKKGKKKARPAAEPPLDSFLEMHAKMFAIASKYDIKSLEQTAREKFRDQFARDWSTADLIAAIGVVCNHTPDREIELRDALKDAIVRHAAVMVEQPGFGEAVANIDGLAYDLFCRQTQAHEFK
jgi:hypothetical protein